MKVSIITATINAEKNILYNLNSIHSQSYKFIEHLVQDCCSNDHTIKIINNFSKNNKKNKILIESVNDNGIYDALNRGIKRSTGDIIGILHSDDEFGSSDIIENIVKIFSSNNQILGIYGNLIYVNSSGKIIRKWISKDFNYKMLKFGWMPPHPTLFLKKEVFKKFGNYNDKYKIAGDYDFIIRIFKQNKNKFSYIPINITKMKLGGKSNKLKNLFLKSYEDYKIIKQNKIGGIHTLLLKNLRKIIQFF